LIKKKVLIVTTQIEGVSFDLQDSMLGRTMYLPVSWAGRDEENFVADGVKFINNGVINKTVFEKLEYMILELDVPECCDVLESQACIDRRNTPPTIYIPGKIADRTIEFILNIAK